MSDLYLVAHKVHGEPAFDVAVRMGCPICCAVPDEAWGQGCTECDSLGYWWIIPTSGHRAYPYAFQPFNAMDLGPGWDVEMPPGLPDHYPTRSADPKPDLSALFKPAPTAHIRRR